MMKEFKDIKLGPGLNRDPLLDKRNTDILNLDEIIKSCPFCGSESEVFYNEDFKSYRVECIVQGHCLDHWEDDEEDAIEIWNKRK